MDCDAVTLFKTGQIDLVALENALLQYKEEEAKKSGIQQFVPVISQQKTKQQIETDEMIRQQLFESNFKPSNQSV